MSGTPEGQSELKKLGKSKLFWGGLFAVGANSDAGVCAVEYHTRVAITAPLIAVGVIALAFTLYKIISLQRTLGELRQGLEYTRQELGEASENIQAVENPEIVQPNDYISEQRDIIDEQGESQSTMLLQLKEVESEAENAKLDIFAGVVLAGLLIICTACGPAMISHMVHHNMR